MSILSWNCQGSGGPSTIPILRCYLRTTGADLAFISETKCSKHKALRRIARLPLPNSEIVPSQGRGGGLWLLWSNSISVSILETSTNYIVARIQVTPAAPPWVLFAIYGDYDDRANDPIWERIEHYTANAALPLCTIGDFNCITDQGEKTGGGGVRLSNPRTSGLEPLYKGLDPSTQVTRVWLSPGQTTNQKGNSS